MRSFDKGLKIVGDTFLSQDSEQLSLLRLQIYRYDATLVSTTSSVARSLNVALRKAARYAGKERDTESGLDYFGARYFGSSMGRFMSPDFGGPAGMSHPDPVPWADLENPQTLNLYSYGNNNPVSNADDDGHDVNICDNNGNCHQVSNEEYQKAQQGNNGGLNVPTLDQVGSNGNGSGQFNATAITDSNGNTVGTATYVSNGNLDYYANANGYQQLATASRATNQVTAGYAIVFGAVGAGMVAADIALGSELTTLENLVTDGPLPTQEQRQLQRASHGSQSGPFRGRTEFPLMPTNECHSQMRQVCRPKLSITQDRFLLQLRLGGGIQVYVPPPE